MSCRRILSEFSFSFWQSQDDDSSVEYIKLGVKSPPILRPLPAAHDVIDIDVSMRNMKISDDEDDGSVSISSGGDVSKRYVKIFLILQIILLFIETCLLRQRMILWFFIFFHSFMVHWYFYVFQLHRMTDKNVTLNTIRLILAVCFGFCIYTNT